MGTEHYTAHDEALRRIRRAGENGEGELCLTDLALERLPDELGELTELTMLQVDGCLELKDISSLALCTRLVVLDLRACPLVMDLSPLRRLNALRELRLGVRNWNEVASGKEPSSVLGDIDALSDLPTLEILMIEGCERISSFQPLSALTRLQSLDLRRCWQLLDLRPLALLTGLQSLDLNGCGQIQDLQPLAELKCLQDLDLSGCDQLQDLRPLAALKSLQHLYLRRCGQLQALWPLSALTSLQSLSLSSCRLIRDLGPLAALTSLQSFNLSWCGQLQDLRPLAVLTSLQTLNLRGCDQLQDLRPLATMTSLQCLDLSGCDQLQDLQPLAALTRLQRLSLSACGLIRDLWPLAVLTRLQSLDLIACDQLQDLQPLSTLTRLQILYLSGCRQLQDLQPLATLTNLHSLNLSGCWQLKDLQPLATLTRLKAVYLFNAGLLDCTPAAQPLASWINLDTLIANRLVAAPPELGSRDEVSDNALPRLRGWQQDLLASEAPNSTVKLYMLGNGGVGKTQICRRLCGEDFDASVPSTRGIRLGRLRLIEPHGDQPSVDANFWDFGGQDVYLGTHALFLDERAIYVIAWNPEHEEAGEFEQNGVLMRDRPLAYWLEYVLSLAGPQAPVIVVQTQCDRELDVRSAPMPTEPGFERLRVTSSSAIQDDGMERLQLELKSAARYQLERYGKVRLPASWVAMGQELRARSHEKTMPHAEFDEFCRVIHGSAAPCAVLEYLHRGGQVFWREGLFGNRVVLDMAWALDGVYAVLERNTALPEIRRQAGRFSPQLLGALVWRNYGEAERELFLSMMEQCQICFKVAEGVYIAPALLPPPEAMQHTLELVWRGAVPDAVVRLDYGFLHEGVLRAMLCSIGEKAGVHAVYWAYGVCFYDAEQKSTVRILADLPDVAAGQAGGSISVEVAGSGAASLATHLVDSIRWVNIGRPPQVTWELGQAVQDARAESEPAGAIDQAFAAMNPAQPPRLQDEAQPVYVSYAWGGESEKLVDEFELRLPKDLKLIRDKNELRPGDWISQFMADIGRADLVLVVLSDKYLRSVYCMRELLYLFNTSLGERDRFMRKLVPLTVGNVPMNRALERVSYVKYWKQEHDKLDKELSVLDHASVGDADRAELLLMKDFQHRVADMLAWLADTLMPQGTELHGKGIDAAIVLLQQRAVTLFNGDGHLS